MYEFIQPLDVINAYGSSDLTLPQHLMLRVRHHADKPFVIFEGTRLSYGEFEQQVDRLVAAFHARGVKRSDCVAVIARNNSAHLLILFAVARMGAIMVPVNPEFGALELAYIIEDSAVSGIIADIETRETVIAAMNEVDVDPFILVIDSSDPNDDFSEAMKNDLRLSCESVVSPHDPCVIIYTSGTTGRPKGVVHSHQNFLRCGQININRLRLQSNDVIMIVLPLFHVNALFYSTAGAFCAGATVVIFPRFSASQFWQQAANSGATTVNVIEAIGNILLARDRSEFRPDNQIRAIYGIRPRYEEAFRREFAIEQIVSGYGLTEIPGVTCGNLEGFNKEHSMGRVLEHPDPDLEWAKCKVVDDCGVELPAGREGELMIQSPAIMLGYYKDAEATSKALCDGWFATGDIVRRDEAGEYYFVSRKKDIIRRRGENISGAELDIVIGSHPHVLEAAAIAVPAELGEDDILVVVVPKAGVDLSALDIANWCKERLAPMKTPQYVTFVDTLPHTATHKIAKALLRSDPTIQARAQKV